MTDLPAIVSGLGAAAAVVVAVAVLLKPVKWFLGLLKRIRDFLDDWQGEPARPGVAARPGVLATLENHGDRLAQLESEFKNNGGSTLRDRVDKIVATVDPGESAQPFHE